MPTKEEYQSWRTATFGSDYDIWHDGLDASVLKTFTGEKREMALVMLRKGVELGDSYAAEALAVVGDVSAVPDLRAQLAQSRGSDKVRVACAINAISPDESLSKDLIEVLEDHSADWGDRIDAAIGLREFGNDASERALCKAVEHDGKYLVRYHATESLLVRWHVVRPTISSHREILELISKPSDGPISTDEQAKLHEAFVLLQNLRKGEE